MTLTTDDLWPRTEEFRYRLYARRQDGDLNEELEILAAAPTMEGIGLAIQTMDEDCHKAGKTLNDLGRIGILDTLAYQRWADDEGRWIGRWIVSPYTRSEAA